MYHDSQKDMLYSAFAHLKRPTEISGCPCCTSDLSRDFMKYPLKSIPAQDLLHFSAKAMTTWGEIEHFMYFWPRILECALRDELREPELYLSKLEMAEFHNWPKNLKLATLEYMEYVLLNDSVHDFSRWLLVFEELGGDPLPITRSKVDDVETLAEIAEKLGSFSDKHRAEISSFINSDEISQVFLNFYQK